MTKLDESLTFNYLEFNCLNCSKRNHKHMEESLSMIPITDTLKVKCDYCKEWREYDIMEVTYRFE